MPTAREIEQAETVAEWLALLGHHHGGVPRLVAWAHDDPVWRMAERERYSERTIHNRIDRSVALILGHFGDAELELPVIDEKPQAAHLPNFVVERSLAGVNPVVNPHGKVWIGGVGWMKNGRRWHDGRDKAGGVMWWAASANERLSRLRGNRGPPGAACTVCAGAASDGESNWTQTDTKH